MNNRKNKKDLNSNNIISPVHNINTIEDMQLLFFMRLPWPLQIIIVQLIPLVVVVVLLLPPVPLTGIVILLIFIHLSTQIE